MSKVPLYLDTKVGAAGDTPAVTVKVLGTFTLQVLRTFTLRVFRTFTWKQRPECGLDCLTCAVFARQRAGAGHAGCACACRTLQAYLAYKKPHHPRTLHQAYA